MGTFIKISLKTTLELHIKTQYKTYFPNVIFIIIDAQHFHTLTPEPISINFSAWPAPVRQQAFT